MPHRRRDESQIAADNWTSRHARRDRVERELRPEDILLGRVGQLPDGLGDKERLLHPLERPAWNRARRDRAMERHQPRLLGDRKMQCRDVGVAQENLGILANQVVVDTIEKSLGPVASSQAEDRRHRRIPKHRVEILEALGLRSGHVAMLGLHGSSQLRFQAEGRVEPRDHVLDPPGVEDVGGGSNEADRVSFFERLRLDHGTRGRGRSRSLFRDGACRERADAGETGDLQELSSCPHARSLRSGSL